MIGVSLVALGACHGYRAGSFRGPQGRFVGEQVTLRCLDVAVSRSLDGAAQGPAVEVAFGNRCRRPVTVDLSRMQARGRDEAGQDVRLVAYDPRGEIRPLPLDGLLVGREVIELQRPGTVDPPPLTQVCVDVGGIDGSAPAAERWVCMGVAR